MSVSAAESLIADVFLICFGQQQGSMTQSNIIYQAIHVSGINSSLFLIFKWNLSLKYPEYHQTYILAYTRAAQPHYCVLWYSHLSLFATHCRLLLLYGMNYGPGQINWMRMQILGADREGRSVVFLFSFLSQRCRRLRVLQSSDAARKKSKPIWCWSDLKTILCMQLQVEPRGFYDNRARHS